jgi:cell wall-associated NlpC family hydrolase
VFLARAAQRIRPAVGLLIVASTTALLLPIGARATPAAPATPTAASATAQLDALARQAERLAEQYNKAQIDVASAQRAAASAHAAAASAQAEFQAAQDQFGATVVAQYEGGSFSATGALLGSSSTQNYLDQLRTLDFIMQKQAVVLARLMKARQVAGTAEQAARGLLHTAEIRRAALSAQRTFVVDQTAKFQNLLRTLSPRQRTAYTSRGSASAADIAALKSVHAGTAAAQRAVTFALAQLGKPYVFGAAGPDAFDCSGLTMAAWAAGGVSLPHFASAQYNYGTHVLLSQLQPGDLVFLYHPIGHVSIYVGKGMVVSAPQPGENVKVVPVSHFAADFAGATRLT